MGNEDIKILQIVFQDEYTDLGDIHNLKNTPENLKLVQEFKAEITKFYNEESEYDSIGDIIADYVDNKFETVQTSRIIIEV